MKILILFLIILFFASFDFSKEKIREPIIAGSWYPGTKEELNNQIESFLSKAKENISLKIQQAPIGIIVPHAGYIYSGYGAATGYYVASKFSYSRIIILAFSHSIPHSSIAISDFDIFRTPIGDLQADTSLANEFLKKSKLFNKIPEIDKQEHSMEIQLPFIKKICSQCKILALYIGQLTEAQFKEAANLLKNYIEPKTLFIVSSDFTHYGENYSYIPFPKNENTRRYLSILDSGAINEITAINPKGFQNHIKETGDTICGRNPITLWLYTLQETKKEDINASLINYYTSGDLVGDYTNSVSYATIVFYKEKKEIKSEFPPLTKEEKKSLLKLARESIKYYFENKSLLSVDENKISLTENLKRIQGAFVTIKINGNLRGCIGHIEPVQELYKDVIENAVNAAFKDPRFSPLTEEEFKKITIEISALSPITKVNNLDEIKVGKHGLIIRKGFYSGVLLPQVPIENGWNKIQFLENLCYKAGLKKDDYKEANLYKFSAEVFSEEEKE